MSIGLITHQLTRSPSILTRVFAIAARSVDGFHVKRFDV